MQSVGKVLSVQFNQDFGCFVCGLDDGLRIFNSDPLNEFYTAKFDGGIAIVEMLFRCNYILLVGGGVRPAFPTNNAILWNISKRVEVTRIEVPTDIRGIRLRRDRIILILFSSLHIYSFTENPEKLQILKSSSNPQGLCCLCPSSENSLLAFPAVSSTSEVSCVNLSTPDVEAIIIKAHKRPLSALSLNSTGMQLATCSVKGTVIRIFDTKTKSLLRELRRGSSTANIFSLNFSIDSTMLCVSSDHSTIHLFSWRKRRKAKNFMDALNSFGLHGETSFSKFRLPTSTKANETRICAFGSLLDSIIGGSDFKISWGRIMICTKFG